VWFGIHKPAGKVLRRKTMKTQIKVLYVEDVKHWQDIVEEVVAMLGFQLDIVSTSEQAASKLERSTYHVAILDKRLDENDPENKEGLNIAAAISGLCEGTRVIVYTIYGKIEDAREAFKTIKVRDFIGKDWPIPVIKKAIEESAAEAVAEFSRPSRISNILSHEDKAINQFLDGFPQKLGLGSNAQDLESFAKRLLSGTLPLLPDRGQAKLFKVANIPILQVRFWSKMLACPIAVWFGKYNDMNAIFQKLDSDPSFKSSLEIGNRLDELFDINIFPQFGGALFELKDAGLGEFISGLQFSSPE
jgi:ActR/RegA family two-component response regulator